jgi:muramoyltetrapeptide carboxypeptidase LdcA involved in peptidoglycan recycling
VLAHAKAIVLGDFGEITSEKNQVQEGLEDFINHYLPARSLHLPVFRLEGFGHGERNKPLPLGVKAKLTADKIIF